MQWTMSLPAGPTHVHVHIAVFNQEVYCMLHEAALPPTARKINSQIESHISQNPILFPEFSNLLKIHAFKGKARASLKQF